MHLGILVSNQMSLGERRCACWPGQAVGGGLLLVLCTWYILSATTEMLAGTHPDLSAIRSLKFIGAQGEIIGFAVPTSISPGNNLPLHTSLTSQTTSDGHYFNITFDAAVKTFNPSILPHPHYDSTWIILAQLRNWDGRNRKLGPAPSIEVVCTTATFINDTLACAENSSNLTSLPIEPTTTLEPDLCRVMLGRLNLSLVLSNVGPHDARMFYGPTTPYVLYGSNSHFTCFGQWLQDLRVLVSTAWEGAEEMPGNSKTTSPAEFSKGTELQRPTGASLFRLEKNWFLFWDADGQAYVHYDIAPTRSFALLHPDGSVGPNSSGGLTTSSSKEADKACLALYLPVLADPDAVPDETVHQTTNSLSITLCRRADPDCHPTDDNTFVMALVQHKITYRFHASYYPYVVLFRRRAPFAIWAVSRHPLWFSGRRAEVDWSAPAALAAEYDDGPVRNATELFYVTAVAWRARGQRYHGFVDDVVFVAFGIEDRRSAGIDVLAGDLLGHMGLCGWDNG